jgi:hypothetical protein
LVEPSLLPVGFDLQREAAGLAGVAERCIAVTNGGVSVGQVDK